MISPRGTYDLQLHDTYFVIPTVQIAISLSMYLGIIGLSYWFLRRYRFANWLTYTNVTLTILSLLVFTLLSSFQVELLQNDLQTFKAINKYSWVLTFMFLVSQFLLIINLAIGLIRGKVKEPAENIT